MDDQTFDLRQAICTIRDLIVRRIRLNERDVVRFGDRFPEKVPRWEGARVELLLLQHEVAELTKDLME